MDKVHWASEEYKYEYDILIHANKDLMLYTVEADNDADAISVAEAFCRDEYGIDVDIQWSEIQAQRRINVI